MDYLVIKDEDLFLLTDVLGNISPESEKGLYTHDTRVLDTYVMTLNEKPLSLLHSSCEKGYISTIHLTNKEEVNDGAVKVRQESLEIKREQIVQKGVFYERVTLFNYARETLPVNIGLSFGSSFTDLFEARGVVRPARGRDLEPVWENGFVRLGYEGLDGVVRRIEVRCDAATKTEAGKFEISGVLTPDQPLVIDIAVRAMVGDEAGLTRSFSEALYALEHAHAEWLNNCMQVTTDNEVFNAMVERGLVDLRVLLTDLGYGSFPVAGIPWFAVPFGRDSIIASLQLLPFNPAIGKGTLRTLAHLQGHEVNAWRAEQPGKILHEMRRGEMANMKEVPYQRYYGSIDGTPLFLILAVEYFRLTNDLAFIEEILPNLKRAIAWLDEYADVDGDGFTEYHVEGSNGLSVQSWKDSYDSMIHVDGQLAESPMAVVEVQGYVYHAKMGLAELLPRLGEDELAARLGAEAEALKQHFNEVFWMPEKEYFALALDKDKKQVQITTSDPGHCLWSGIVDEEKVQPLVDCLMSDGLFSGWGVRTVSSEEAVYSPISYHNGSVWSHDNSLVLMGLAKQGAEEAVNRLSEALLKASLQFDYQRLPELFCGHDDSLGSIVRYPVACIPQAWAAGTPLVIAQAILGVDVDVARKVVRLSPTWPDFVNRIEVKHMPVENTVVSFAIDKREGLQLLESNGYNVELKQTEGIPQPL
ncbi:glycogen debranching N-terminal domain-containing protein [Alicyclobacillus fodiniaquatilis]|uniref:Glycogen debranching N-terminal domain-containing protein n=1 Tax=Alicyclobacillus fodiniaquatilis TaxID=1661150 RepID=A0ABW4JIH6_9BACL